MAKVVGISEAARTLGVSVSTLRRWEATGKLPAEHTAGGHRRYDLARLKPEFFRGGDAPNRRTVAYVRASGPEREAVLERQREALALYCSRQGWRFEVIADLGSGLDGRKPGLLRLLEAIADGEIGRLVLARRDRLLRFGAELVFALCEARGVEVVLLNQDGDEDFEEELEEDVREIIALFAARLYGERSRRTRNLLAGMERALEDARC